ncbi:hypothetical protein GCM10008967_35200 [Bacillus carboniphilus]|uniref:Transporter n=1 Tax=Bacillus carboniphilus TaxID=86663 RepID=A0ABN0WN12_9BACI
MKPFMKTIYEGIMILLVMLTIMTIWTEETYNSTINWIVWFVFVVDFIIRLWASNNKWTFLKQNPFLVLAIIPFGQFFQVARIVRVIYLFRIKTITKYYVTPYIEKLSYRSMTLVVSIVIALLAIESFIVYFAEVSIESYFDALYVIVGHLFFFGHQVYAIEKAWMVWMLTGTSILGIVIQGLALQWVFLKIEKYIPSKREEMEKEG